MALKKIPSRQLDLGLAEIFTPSAEDPAGNQITVSAGRIKDGVNFYYSAAQTTVGFNPVSSILYSRWDLVYIDLTSTVQVLQGTEALNPVPDYYGMPDLPPYCFPIAAVKITEAGSVIVEQTDILDIRPLLNLAENRTYGHNYVLVDDTYYQEALGTLDAESQTMAEFSGRDSALQTSPEYSSKSSPEYSITDGNSLALSVALLDVEANRVKEFVGKDSLIQNAPDYSGLTSHNYITINDPLRDAVGKLDNALKESIPVGSITAYLGSTDDLVDPDIPTGWLECDGALISRTAYSDLFTELGETFDAGDGLTTFGLPDLRGQFLRGYDHGAAIDTGRTYCSYQADMLKDHTHATRNYLVSFQPGIWANTGEDIGNASDTQGVNPPDNGATETAPKNYAVIWLIKY